MIKLMSQESRELWTWALNGALLTEGGDDDRFFESFSKNIQFFDINFLRTCDLTIRLNLTRTKMFYSEWIDFLDSIQLAIGFKLSRKKLITRGDNRCKVVNLHTLRSVK